VAAIKEKIRICNRVEDLEIQKRRDLKKIEELEKANVKLRSEHGILGKQLESEKENWAKKERAFKPTERSQLDNQEAS
jgi:hypothetical protein